MYKVNCSDCSEFYIGMTTRRVQQRLSEHSSSESSALYKHGAETGHSIDFGNPDILAADSFKTRLLVKETLKIQELRSGKQIPKVYWVL